MAAAPENRLEWLLGLKEHPILSGLSFKDISSTNPAPSNLQRRLCIRNHDIIVADGNEVRMMPLKAVKGTSNVGSGYKRLHLPNLQFAIRQLSLNPNGKLLAVCGSHQVAVIALPREGYVKSIHDAVVCRYVEIGQYYHDGLASPPIAKIGWHPWGESGSTLLVLTADGIMREYDTSVNPEIPQQVLSFLPETRRSTRSFNPHKESATSFTVGQGLADWGPLTMYVLTNNGNVYAACPYLPRNTAMPVDFFNSLEGYVNGKRVYGTPENAGLNEQQQQQYLKAIWRQLSSQQRLTLASPEYGLQEFVIRGTKLPEKQTLIQGPFLFQPTPHELEETEGGDATDMLYTHIRDCSAVEDESLNVMIIIYEDGKLDICLDIQKVEAKWVGNSKPGLHDPPSVLTYESIGLDAKLGFTSASLISPSLYSSSPYTFYICHSNGLQCVSIERWARSLKASLAGNTTSPSDVLASSLHSECTWVIRTGNRGEYPVIGLAMIDGERTTHGLLVLTSKPEALILEFESSHATKSDVEIRAGSHGSFLTPQKVTTSQKPLWPTAPVHPTDTQSSLLCMEPYKAPDISFKGPSIPNGISAAAAKRHIEPSVDALRNLRDTCEVLREPIQQITARTQELYSRIDLQQEEQSHQHAMEGDLVDRFKSLQDTLQKFTERLQLTAQNSERLKARLDRINTTLLSKASPALSAAEKAWFNEITELQQRVSGWSSWDERALSVRAAKMHRDIAELEKRTQVDQQTQHIPAQFIYSPPRPQTWGSDQLHRYVSRLGYLQRELEGLQGDSMLLATKLGQKA